MTIYTVYANANDFYVKSTNATYSTARAGAALTSSTGTDDVAGQWLDSKGPTYDVWQGFLSFDTSAIPTGTESGLGVILNVTSAGGSKTYEIREHAWATADTSAWVAGASLSGKTLFSSLAISTTGAKTFSSAGALTRSTAYKMLVCGADQTNNVAPSSLERIIFSAVEATGTTNDPYLTVDVSTTVDYTLACDSGAFTYTGGACSFQLTTALAGGSFALTGGALLFSRGTIVCGGGAFTLTGGAMSPAFVGATGLDAGAFTLTGGATALPLSVSLAGGSFILTGGDMTPKRAVSLALAGGSFTYSGGALSFASAYRPALASGTFSLSGGAMNPFYWEPGAGTAASWSAIASTTGTWTEITPTSGTWTEVKPF